MSPFSFLIRNEVYRHIQYIQIQGIQIPHRGYLTELYGWFMWPCQLVPNSVVRFLSNVGFCSSQSRFGQAEQGFKFEISKNIDTGAYIHLLTISELTFTHKKKKHFW